jgi:hypothetical protein
MTWSWGALLLLLACSSTPMEGVADGDPQPIALRVVVVATGLNSPVHLTAPPGDARLFVVEQAGRIRIIQSGLLLSGPFLDIVDRVGSGGERGLLSVAFHPAYASNGFFYVNYTDRGGATRIERYRVSSDANVADPGSARLVLTVAQPFANHNGGLVLFGPDGKLYIGMGDGGGAGDPLGHGQNRATLLGALLRIDVDAGDPYRVPPDNPVVGDPAARGEIGAYGLRNPWRFSFAGETGDLYIADVGQNAWEEVNAIAGALRGLNYGWNIMEGRHCFRVANCDADGLILPVLEYDHSSGCSITGGAVYRGGAVPEIRGHYFYSDYCRGWLRSFRLASGRAVDEREWAVGSLGNVTSFGEDAAGELYVLNAAGQVFRLERR